MLRYKIMLRAERSNKRETMSLKVNTNLSGKINKTLMLSMAMLALVVQPLYSLAAANVASAGSESVRSLVFEQTSPTEVIKDADSSKISVRLKNATGGYQPVDAKVDLVIHSDSETGRFATDSKLKYGKSNDLKHSISKDSSTASFYYKDSTTGSPTLTATVSIKIKSVTTEFKDTHVINVLPDKPVDTQAPTISNISFSATQNSNIGGKVTVYFELNDDTGIDVERSKVMFQDGPGTSRHPAESEKVSPVLVEGIKYRAEFDTTKFVPNSTTARYTLGFNPYDTLGNQSSVKPMSVLIDNSGPTATLVSPSSGSYLYNQIVFTFDITDDSGVKSGYAKLVKIDDDKVQQSAILTPESTGRWQALFDTKDMPEGEYKLDIRPVDVFGQPRYRSGVAKFTVDKTSPTITIKDSSKGKDGYFSKLDLKLFDDKSIKSYQFNGGAIQDVGVNNLSDINDIFPGSWRGLSEGAHSVRVYDLAGNWTDFDFTLDNTAPKVSLEGAAEGSSHKENVNIRGVVEDKNHSHFWLTVTKDGKAYNIPGTTDTDVLGPEFTHLFDEEGTYSVLFEAWDKAGNHSDARLLFYIDKTGPEVSIDKDDLTTMVLRGTVKGADAKSYIDLNFYILDANGDKSSVLKKQISVVDGAWELKLDDSDASLFTNETEYQLEVTGYDLTDNSATDTGSFKFLRMSNEGENIPEVPGGDDEGGEQAVNGDNNPVVETEPGGQAPIVEETPNNEGGSEEQPPVVDDISEAEGATEEPVVVVGNTPSAENVEQQRPIIPDTRIGFGSVSAPVFVPAFVESSLSEPSDDVSDEGETQVAAVMSDRARASADSDMQDGEVLSASNSNNNWSLINLILAIIILLMSLASLPGLFLNRQNRRIYVRLLTLAPAVGGLVLLFFVENFSGPMIIMNIWTVALAALVLLQGIIVSQINIENSVK